MAKIIYSPGIAYTLGALDSDHTLITRKKHIRDFQGKVAKECESESYYQRHKRDYISNPAKGAELEHLQHFGEAAKRTTALMKAFKNPSATTPEERAKLEQLKQKFETQDGTGKRYYRFDNFVRAMIYKELTNKQ